MKRTIRLRESELRRMISESVKRVLKEFDEYNEFDRNLKDEVESDCYQARLRFQNGDYSKMTIDTLIHGIYEGDEEAYDAYDYAKSNGICPQFVKKVENVMSWKEFGDTEVAADVARKNADYWGTRDWLDNGLENYYYGNHEIPADAADENGNRFNNALASTRSDKESPNDFAPRSGHHIGILAQGDESKPTTKNARKFNGTRRSYRTY